MPQSRQTNGPIDRVPCPHCGKNNDFRELQSQQIMDTSSDVSCDFCGRQMRIAAIRTVTFLAVVQIMTGGALPQPAAPQRTVGGAVRRFLKGG